MEMDVDQGARTPPRGNRGENTVFGDEERKIAGGQSSRRPQALSSSKEEKRDPPVSCDSVCVCFPFAPSGLEKALRSKTKAFTPETARATVLADLQRLITMAKEEDMQLESPVHATITSLVESRMPRYEATLHFRSPVKLALFKQQIKTSNICKINGFMLSDARATMLRGVVGPLCRADIDRLHDRIIGIIDLDDGNDHLQLVRNEGKDSAKFQCSTQLLASFMALKKQDKLPFPLNKMVWRIRRKPFGRRGLCRVCDAPHRSGKCWGTRVCANCHKPDHSLRECQQQLPRKPKCDLCHKEGHLYPDCENYREYLVEVTPDKADIILGTSVDIKPMSVETSVRPPARSNSGFAVQFPAQQTKSSKSAKSSRPQTPRAQPATANNKTSYSTAAKQGSKQQDKTKSTSSNRTKKPGPSQHEFDKKYDEQHESPGNDMLATIASLQQTIAQLTKELERERAARKRDADEMTSLRAQITEIMAFIKFPQQGGAQRDQPRGSQAADNDGFITPASRSRSKRSRGDRDDAQNAASCHPQHSYDTRRSSTVNNPTDSRSRHSDRDDDQDDQDQDDREHDDSVSQCSRASKASRITTSNQQ